jgi:hypothetical protein
VGARDNSRHFTDNSLRSGEKSLSCIEDRFRFQVNCLGSTDCGLEDLDHCLDRRDLSFDSMDHGFQKLDHGLRR